MKAALLQMVSAADVQRNLDTVAALLSEAARQQAELAVLPEYFCLMGHQDTDKLHIAEPWGDGPIQTRLSALAAQHGLWLVAGSMPLAVQGDSQHVTNSCLVFNPQGACVARYDKIHLFYFDNGKERYDEARVQRAGDTPVCFDVPSRDGHTWRIGLSICFDVLVRARALDNLVWVGAAAQAGEHDNGRRTWGHSIWVDPWGQVVACQPQQAACVVADLRKLTLRERRMQMPALNTASV